MGGRNNCCRCALAVVTTERHAERLWEGKSRRSSWERLAERLWEGLKMRRSKNGRPEKLRSLQAELASQLRSFAAETDETSRRRAGREIEIDHPAEFEALHDRPTGNSHCPVAKDRCGRKTARTVLQGSTRLDPAHY